MINKFKIGDKVKVVRVNTIDKKYFLNEILTIDFINEKIGLAFFEEKKCWFGLFLNQIEKLEQKKIKKSKVNDIQIITKGTMTKVIIDDKVGVAKCDNSIDIFDSKIGVLIATARALGFKKDEVDGIIEVIFNDVKKLTAKDLSNEELFEEIKRRLDEQKEKVV